QAVTTIVAGRESWPATLSAIGSVTAVHGVTVSADLPGIVERIAFDSGEWVEAGEVLVQLDTRQEQAQLAAAEARRDLARVELARMVGLRVKGVVAQAEYDAADAAYKQAEASVGEIRALIDRKTIRAPFAGLLGIRMVDLGEYLTSGASVVPLQSLDPVHVDFTLPQQEVGRLRAGGAVRVTLDGLPDMTGEISAIDSVVDEATRNVQVRATLANPERALRPGMFAKVELTFDEEDLLISLPASAISYAPYGDSVFIVQDIESPDGRTYRGVRQQFVKLGGGRGDRVAVLGGVEPGQEVVTSGVFTLFNGAPVMVNNEVAPGNDPAPRPEES
ncbi:MAG: efflux RND transporter periplasmic adaptor subunit, partial [Actinobacteria bacterium]|nr:efflux RND transporter periplasmic adaptor subunit [Actinomycetota bacterium]